MSEQTKESKEPREEREQRATKNEDGTVTITLSAETTRMIEELDAFMKNAHPMLSALMEIADKLAKDSPEAFERLEKLKERYITVPYVIHVEAAVASGYRGIKSEDEEESEGIPVGIFIAGGAGEGKDIRRKVLESLARMQGEKNYRGRH